MIAVDTNILVYAHREDSPWHAVAYEKLRFLAERSRSWAIPWPCLHEFLAIVTHPRIFSPPTPLTLATDQMSAWLESPTLVLLSEGPSYWEKLRTLLERTRVSGAQIHDARIAAICIDHQVDELWTADRDFGRFQDLDVRNPLVD